MLKHGNKETDAALVLIAAETRRLQLAEDLAERDSKPGAEHWRNVAEKHRHLIAHLRASYV